MALIIARGIYIYTIANDFLRLRYYGYYRDIQETLDNEFNDSQFSLPLPKFKIIYELNNAKYKELILYIINDPVEFSKFGPEILELAIIYNNNFIVQTIFDKLFEFIKSDSTNSYNTALLSLISQKLPELCNHNSNFLVTKYILLTSILPFCSSVKHSANTSLYAYSLNINVIKKRFLLSDVFYDILISYRIIFLLLCICFIPLILFIYFIGFIYYIYSKCFKTQEEIPTVSFIVPFSQICKYQDKSYIDQHDQSKVHKDYNPWNEFLYKPKSILFCNVDTKDFYKWWNFAAIVDFKWRTFGRYYYYLIWFFYTIFSLCFALASTLDQDSITDIHRKILFIISIVFGLIHLYFEFQQLLWRLRIYVKDLWNLFGK